jgi:MFS family permease
MTSASLFLRSPLDFDARQRRKLLGMVAGAFLLRLAVLAALFLLGDSSPLDWAPHMETYRVAQSLANGHGFASPFALSSGPTAFLLPVYPLLLAGLSALLHGQPAMLIAAALLMNTLASAATCLPIYYLALRVTGRERAATGAAWTWAVFPYAVYIPVTQIWEASFAPLLFASLMLLTLRLVESPSVARWMAFGALWGVTTLTTSSFLLVLPVTGLWAAYHTWRQGREWFAGAALAALVFLSILSPWFLRNQQVFGRFIPLRSNLPLELYVGNTLETDVQWRSWLHPNESRAALQEFVQKGELAFMEEKGRKFAEFRREHPDTFLWLTLKRMVFYWTWIWDVRAGYLWAKPLEAINILLASALSVFGWAGLRDLLRANRPMGVLVLLVFLCMPLLYYVTHVNLRYRHPADVLLIILAVPVLQRWRQCQPG